MASKKPKKRAIKKNCKCGGECFEKDSHLPGYLLIGFGLLALPANLGYFGSAVTAWPLFIALIGCVLVVKVALCKKHTKKGI
ncbi:hypothetical protein HY988_01935 [Candidatus Micrarchaeota archaeon]|nr:hypothetical protein [Candidatus Micrarchaeota archaeon]